MKKYKIKKDNHRCNRILPKILFSKSLKFEFIFNDSSFYKFNDIDDFDVNKLIGFNKGFNHHHKNSIRIGWRPYKNRIMLYSYVYDNGNRIIKKILDVDINKKYLCEIIERKNNYIISISEANVFVNIQHRFNIPFNNRDFFNFRYVLFPYFGGNKKAPHNMFFEINFK